MIRNDEQHMNPVGGSEVLSPAIVLEYTVLRMGDDQRVLIAHDRRWLEYVLTHDAPAERVLRTASADDDPSLAIRVELQALRQLQRAARRARARRLGIYVAAIGLPFLTGALVSLIGMWLELVPRIGGLLETFVGSAGSSVAGLPLAVVVSAVPSVWLVQWARKSGQTARAPRVPAKTLARSRFHLDHDMGGVEIEAGEVLQDLYEILGGNPRASGERASRAARRFEGLERVAAKHRLPSVMAFSAEVADRLRRASAPPRRIVPGLRGRRLSVYLAEVLRPYDPRALRRRVLVAPWIPALAGGMLVAVFAFLAAGAFRLGNEEVLVVRGNEAIAFPSSAIVFRLPVGFDSPSVEGAGTVSVVDGVGIYWAWPRPLTDRALLKLNDRPALAMAPLGSHTQDYFVEVEFRYDIKEVRTFLRAVPLATADARIGAFLEFNLAQFLPAELARLEESGGDENSDLVDLIRLEIVAWLGEFVRAVNLNGSAEQIGIQVRTDPIHRFSNP